MNDLECFKGKKENRNENKKGIEIEMKKVK